jgi:hypothetical protein
MTSFLLDPGPNPSVPIRSTPVGGEEVQHVYLVFGAGGTVPSDTAPFPVREPRKSTGTNVSVDATASSSTVLAANGSRDTFQLWHDGSAETVYLALGGAAVVGKGPRLSAGESFGLTGYTGEVRAITTAGTVHLCGYEV